MALDLSIAVGVSTHRIVAPCRIAPPRPPIRELHAAVPRRAAGNTNARGLWGPRAPGTTADYWPLVSCSVSIADLPSPPITYVIREESA